LVLALAPAAQASVVAITSVTSTTAGDLSDPFGTAPFQTIILDSITVGSGVDAVTYDTDDLVTGTSSPASGTDDLSGQDDFDMNTYYGRSSSGLGWTTSFSEDLVGATFFLFDAKGNDQVLVRPIYSGGPGTYVEITSSGKTGFEANYNWGDTLIEITDGGTQVGANAFGVSFSYFDLLDDNGFALTNQVITGIEFSGPTGLDVSNVSASLVPEPSAALLLGVAGMGLLVRRRRA
jgi:hypothetical protein